MKTVTILCGIPGSGKSTWVQKDLVNQEGSFVVLNADSIRNELYGDERIQGNGRTVFQILYDRFRRALVNEKMPAIYIDNTSTTKKSRKEIFSLIEKYCPECNINIKVLIAFSNG